MNIMLMERWRTFMAGTAKTSKALPGGAAKVRGKQNAP